MKCTGGQINEMEKWYNARVPWWPALYGWIIRLEKRRKDKKMEHTERINWENGYESTFLCVSLNETNLGVKTVVIKEKKIFLNCKDVARN